MAYNTIVQFEYKDINDVDTVVKVKQLGYTGAATVRRYVTAGSKFTWGDSSNNVPVIYGSQCSVFIESETDFEFLYLYSANSRKHLVEVWKAGQLFWMGFIEPDSWSEPLVAAPYAVEFTAYDGLGMLDNIDFADADGSSYTGKKTLVSLIQQLLSASGLTLTLNTATDFWEAGQTAGTNYFEVHSVNLEAFEGMSCLEVLQQILQGHRIQQRNGAWWIISHTLMPTGGSVTFKQYLNGSSEPSGTVIESIEDNSTWWSEGETDMNMLPALRQLTVTQDYGYKSNLILNGDFSSRKNGELSNWMPVNVEPVVKPIGKDGDVMLYIPGRQSTSTGGIVITDYLLSDGLSMNPGNGLMKLSLKYGFIGDDEHYENVRVQIMLTTGVTTYYLRAYENETTEKLAYEWRSDFGFSIHLGRQYGVNTTSKQTAAQGTSLDEIGDKLKSYTLTMPSVPVPGIVRIGLAKLWTAKTAEEAQGCVFADVALEATLSEDDDYEGCQELTVVNNTANNNVPDDIELVIGIVPDIANNTLIYKGGILRSDGSPATGFRAGTSAYYSFAELVGRINASVQRNPRRAYEGTFADLVPRMNLVITDENNNNIRLIETGISYDDGMATVEGQYIEVLSKSLVAGQEGAFIISAKSSTGTSGSNSGGGSGSGGSSTPAPGNYWKKDELVQDDGYLYTSEGKVKAGFADNAGLLNGFADLSFWKKSELVQSGGYLLYNSTKLSAGFADNSGLLNGFADSEFWKKTELVQSSGYLYYNSAKIRAGYADNAGLLDGIDSSQFLRRDIAQTVTGSTDWQAQLSALYGFNAGLSGVSYLEMLSDLIALKKSTGSAAYTSGFAGAGWRIDAATNHLTVDELTVRKAMNVYELVVNQIRGTNGALWVSDAAKVAAVSGNRLTIDTGGSASLVPFTANDLIRCQRWTGNNIKYYVAQVTAVGSDYIEVTSKN